MNDQVAIVGMACVFPGAPDVAAFRSNLCAGVDAIRDVPAHRWDPVYYEVGTRASDRLPCRRGGFIDEYALCHPTEQGVMPIAIDSMDPDQLLTFEVARAALADAGYRRDARHERAGIILGRLGIASLGHQRIEQHVRGATQLQEALRTLAPDLSATAIASIKEEFQRRIGPTSCDSASPNLVASRVANRLNMRGPAYTIDAACASSLVAVDLARKELLSGAVDLMLCGGIHLCHTEAFWATFHQIGALSRSGNIRPFDERADGLLLAEGIGMIVLKREADAIRDGDRIYSVIRAAGISSDGWGTGPMNPSSEGQVLAFERAWRSSGLDPADVGLIEAHGTGTPVGDTTELESTMRFFSPRDRHSPLIGSVKSMIGHAMASAGIAGLIKAALAIHYEMLPPTLHCERPRPELLAAGLQIASRAARWECARRIAGVSAFGFGGINVHVVLENAAQSAHTMARVSSTDQRNVGSVRFSGETSADVLAALAERNFQTDKGPHRLGVVDPTPERLAKAARIVRAGRRVFGMQVGLFYSSSQLLGAGAKVALLFPGLNVETAADAEPLGRALGLRLVGTRAEHVEEDTPEGVATKLFRNNRIVRAALHEMGVVPDAVGGHSLGEISAMEAAGGITETLLMHVLKGLSLNDTVFGRVQSLAIFASLSVVEEIAGRIGDVFISHDNCRKQVVVCGLEERMEEVTRICAKEGLVVQAVPFTTGAHSPWFDDKIAALERFTSKTHLERWKIPIYSCATTFRYPDNAHEGLALMIRQLSKRVRFRETILRMHEDGIRLFIDAGGGQLAAFVADTLGGLPHVALSMLDKGRSPLEQVERVSCGIWAEGGKLVGASSREPQPLTADRGAVARRVALGLPLVRFEDPTLAPQIHTRCFVPAGLGDSVPQVHGVGAEENSWRTRLSLRDFPELADHAFFRQWEGASDSDRCPVVPMSGLVELMRRASTSLEPDRVPLLVEKIVAVRTLGVGAPVDVECLCRRIAPGRLSVSMGEFARCEVVFAVGGEAMPPVIPPHSEMRPVPISARDVYRDRLMFHGPRYRGLRELLGMSPTGIHGRIEVGSALGSTLDNMGQLFGIWLSLTQRRNRLAIPAQIQRLRFHGSEPRPGTFLDCSVSVREIDDESAVADISAAVIGDASSGIVVEGYIARRYECDARLWQMITWPEKNTLAEVVSGRISFYFDEYRSALTRDYLAGRYLCEEERAAFSALPSLKRRAWLAGRIAAKDAARTHLWNAGYGPLFPGEVLIRNELTGAPYFATVCPELRLSIAHSEAAAVAIVHERDVGIDVQKIEHRPESFERAAFNEEERTFLPVEARSEWLTRAWCAKEAVSKMRRRGLVDGPLALAIEFCDGERFVVDGVPVTTIRLGTYAIGVCEDAST